MLFAKLRGSLVFAPYVPSHLCALRALRTFMSSRLRAFLTCLIYAIWAPSLLGLCALTTRLSILFVCLNPFQDEPFRGCSRMRGRGSKGPPSLKSVTHPAQIKLIPYLKKIQKIYDLRDTSLDFCWYQHFFTGNQQILLHQDIDCMVIHNF